MVDGAAAAHAKPLGHLHVGGDGVVENLGVGGSVVEVVHVARLEGGVLHGGQGGIAKPVALGEAKQVGVVVDVHEGGSANADDGDASAELTKLSRDHQTFFLFLTRCRALLTIQTLCRSEQVTNTSGACCVATGATLGPLL